jgi:hypothetical protein
MRVKNTTLNQNGEIVMEMTCLVFAPCRPADA